MKIKIINPNTFLDMTRSIGEAADRYAKPDTQVVTVSPERGPLSIEDHYDEALAAVGVMEEVKKGEKEGFDGYVVACFGDPGLYACREITEKPVVGIAEAALFMACMLGHRFSILSVLSRIEALMHDLLKKYGVESRCVSVRCTDIPVCDFERLKDTAKKVLLQVGKQAVEEDGAEVLCLGCAGMAGLDEELEKELKVPVIDPVVAALKFVEGLVEYGKKTSKTKSFKFPEKKEIKGFPDTLKL
jgi:allantoin racemase